MKVLSLTNNVSHKELEQYNCREGQNKIYVVQKQQYVAWKDYCQFVALGSMLFDDDMFRSKDV